MFKRKLRLLLILGLFSVMLDMLPNNSIFFTNIVYAKKLKRFNAKIRYQVEHRYIPSYFYKDGTTFYDEIIKTNGERIFELYKDDCEANDMVNPFNKANFSIQMHKVGKTIQILQINMPKASIAPQCIRTYACYDTKTKIKHYFTVEQSHGKGVFLCSWSDKGTHNNFGQITAIPATELKRVTELFTKMVEKK